MARLQILELPMVHNGDVSETPFALVIDQVPSDEVAFDAIRRDLLTNGDLAPNVGARAVLVFETTVDIPANDVAAPLDDAFKAEVQQWAAGTNETLARLVEALSYPRKRPRRDDDSDATGEPHPTFDDRKARATVAGGDEQYREQIREGVLYAQGKVTRTVQSADDA